MYRMPCAIIYLTACSAGVLRHDEQVNNKQDDKLVYRPEQITAGSEASFSPSLAPSGDWLVYASNYGDSKDIWRKPISGGLAQQLTKHVADDYSPSVSPDGGRVAFVSRRDDAAGDIYIAKLQGFSLSKLFGSNEIEMKSVPLKFTEDTHPAWFPDSKKIVFAARRPAEKTPQLMIASIDSDEAVPLEGVFGDQPSVSPDGKTIAFVKEGGIFLWDSVEKKIHQLTQGGKVQDGQPSFSTKGDFLVFVRYLDDTNNDQKINADDRGTVWRFNLAKQINESIKENYNIAPLTAANYSAYSPQIRGEFLYLGLQTEENLDIFRLPKHGQVQPADDLQILTDKLEELRDPWYSLLLLRASQSGWFSEGKTEQAAAAALLELNVLVDGARSSEAKWHYEKFVQNFSHLSDKVALADLALIELELKPLLYPEYQKDLTESQEKLLQNLFERTHAVRMRFEADKANFPEIVDANIKLVQARILASKRRFFDALEILVSLIDNKSLDRNVAGRAALARALILHATADLDTCIAALRQVVQDYRQDKKTVRTAANYAIQFIMGSSDQPIEELVKLRNSASGLPIMPALAHLTIAEYFRGQKKPAVEANELRQIVDLYPESPEIMLEAATRLTALEERAERYDSAEQSLTKLNDRLQLSAPQFKNDARDLLVQFWLRRGETFLRDKDLNNASEYYRKVIAIVPDNINAHRGLIDAGYKGKNWDKLLVYYDKQANAFSQVASWRYINAYALTYKIDQCDDVSCRLSSIDDAIAEVIEARDLDSQILQIHQTLGWLYLQRSYWQKRYREAGGLVSWLSRRLTILKSTFSSSETNWLMASIESFQTAYFLANPESIEQASLAQNLGQTYFELGNFQKALSYFSRRIKMLPVLPMRDPRAEGSLLRRAGRAAFQIDELAYAEALQRKALSIWEQLGDSEQIASSLDSLALTLREQQRFNDAIVLYERLLEYNKKTGNLKGMLSTYQSISYCYFSSDNFEKSLEHYGHTEDTIAAIRKAIDNGTIPKDNFSTSAIRAPMPDVSTAPDGFSINRHEIIAQSFKSKIYEKTGRSDLQLRSLLKKIELLKAERERMIGTDGYGKNVLLDEISLAWNAAGALYIKLGQHQDAKLAFEEARFAANKLRPDNQKYMTASESVNFVNVNRVDLRLAQMGFLTEDAILKAVGDLDSESAALGAPLAEGSLVEARPFSQMLTLSAVFNEQVANEDAGFKERQRERLNDALKAQINGNFKRRDRYGTLFASATLSGHPGDANDARIRNEIENFAKISSKKSSLKWKMAAAKQDWLKAFSDVGQSIEDGELLRSPTDRALFRHIFEEIISKSDSASSERFAYLRKYLRLRYLDLAHRSFDTKSPNSSNQKREKTKVSSGIFDLLSIKDNEEIRKTLSTNDAVLVVHRAIAGKIQAFLIGKKTESFGSLETINRDYRDPDSLSELFKMKDLEASLPQEGGRLYLTPSAELYDLSWEDIQIRGQRLGDYYQLVFLPSPDNLPSVFAKRSLPKQTIGHLLSNDKKSIATDNTVNRSRHTNLSVDVIAQVNSQRFYQVISSDNNGLSVSRRFPLFDLIHIDTPFYLNDVEPSQSVIKSGGDDLPLGHYADATLSQLAALELPATNALILSRLERNTRELAGVGEASDGWVAATIAAVESGISTLVMPKVGDGVDVGKSNYKNNNQNETQYSHTRDQDWGKFYGFLTSFSVVESVQKSGMKLRVHGYGGIPGSDEEQYAREHLDSSVEEAEDLWAEKNFMAAAGAYKQAMYFAQRLSQKDKVPYFLDRISKAYFQRREFASALLFQTRLIETLSEQQKASDADPIEFAKTLLESAVVAVKAEAYESAHRWLDLADRISQDEGEEELLGKVWQYRAISFESQNKYQETIASYEKSVEIYRQANPTQESLVLLALGNIYANRLGEFAKAIDYYDKASKGFKERGDIQNYLQVLTDRSAALMQIGQLQEAIETLEKSVLSLLDREKNLVPWIRASQRLANCYYRAGLYQEAMGRNNAIIDAVEDVEQDGLRISLSLDAISLSGMILAKNGKIKDSFAQFNAGIKEAMQYNLDAQLAMLYNNYGFWAREAGLVDQSIDLFNSALKIDEKAQSMRDIAYDKRNLAFSIMIKGDYDRAQQLLENALEISKSMNISHNIAYSYFGLGDIYMRRRNWEEARLAYNQALQTAQKGYLKDFVWRAYAGVAASYFEQGDFAEAEKNLAEAVKVIEGLRAGLNSDGSPNKFYSETGVQEVYEKYALVLMERGKIEAAWQAAERSRARSFIDTIGSQKIKFGTERLNQLLAEEQKLKSELEFLERRLSLRSNSGQPDDSQKAWVSTKKSYDDLKLEIRKNYAQLNDFVSIDAISKEQLSQFVGNDAAVLQFLVTDNNLLIWVIRDGVVSGEVVKVSAEKIQKIVSDFRNLMENYSSTEYLGKELSALLISPVRNLLSGIQRVAIVPHRYLHFLSFAALPDHDGRFLSDSFGIYYLDSSTMARYTHRIENLKDSRWQTVFALANPDIKDSIRESLPFAKREVEVISRYYDNVTLYSGGEAQEAKLAGLDNKHSILHIASHGDFYPNDPAKSALILAEGGGEDGNLSVGEIFSLPIKADMVTLSACESGMGALSRADEVIGMTRAFLFTGADTVVTSLWRINDVSSAVLMKRFYRYLAAGDNKAEAMRKAQSTVRKYFKHPAYWAGFRVVGSYQ